MTTTRCYRHTRYWLAACPDCTAWHHAHQPRRPTATTTAAAPL
jgi:hypothetical protein